MFVCLFLFVFRCVGSRGSRASTPLSSATNQATNGCWRRKERARSDSMHATTATAASQLTNRSIHSQSTAPVPLQSSHHTLSRQPSTRGSESGCFQPLPGRPSSAASAERESEQEQAMDEVAVVRAILASMGVTDYDPKVATLLAEYLRRTSLPASWVDVGGSGWERGRGALNAKALIR